MRHQRLLAVSCLGHSVELSRLGPFEHVAGLVVSAATAWNLSLSGGAVLGFPHLPVRDAWALGQGHFPDLPQILPGPWG